MTQKGWRQFIELCRHVQTDEALEELFDLLLTLEEQEQLATRVELLKALLKGDKPQRLIAEELKISIAKMSRGSNALKIIKPSLRRYLIEELL
jgi:TrpR family trp operon transcriptional repressor